MSHLPNARSKSSFEKKNTIAPLYTGGPVSVSVDGSRIVTCVGEDAILTRLDNGEQICRFVGDTTQIHSLCLSPSSNHLAVLTGSLALHIYEVPQSLHESTEKVKPIRTVARAHDAPAHVCKFDPTSTYLASGSADGVVKVWDFARGFVTHAFKGHGGVVSALAFVYPRDASSVVGDIRMHLITASVDTRIRIFDLSSIASRSSGSKPIAVLEGHVSVPRGLDVTSNGKWLVSGGRDSVVLIWDLASIMNAGTGHKSKKSKEATAPVLKKTIPVLDRVEAIGLVNLGEDDNLGADRLSDLRFYTAGAKGVVKIWDASEASVLFVLGEQHEEPVEDGEEQHQIVDAIYIPSKSEVVSVHMDQNIIIHSLSTREVTRQIVGFNDEIIDAVFLSPTSSDSHLAIAANSPLIRVYRTENSDARLLSGHSGIVLCLDKDSSGRVLASGSKDKSARLWAYSGDTGKWECAAVCEGHAESVGAVALSRQKPVDGQREWPAFLFTGSQDRTIKMWDLLGVAFGDQAASGPVRCKSLTTHKAHDKDINSLDVAPNDRLLASGSQDKTAKVYEIVYTTSSSGVVKGEIKHIGTCAGHKRGVWTVRFSRTERLLATGSGDKTIKLWNLDDFSCVKTFEGHTNSVLRVDFLTQGMQLVSTASDGLLKLWNVRDEECVATMDNHEDKVWALAVSSDEQRIVTGAADSMITVWEDCTEEKAREKEEKRTEQVLKEQDLQNYLALHDYRSAISLALAMDQPGRLFTLFKTISSKTLDADASAQPGITGNVAVDGVIRGLPPPELAKLLRHIRDWNTRAKTSTVGQTVLHAVFKLKSPEEIQKAFTKRVDFPDVELRGNDSSLQLSELLEAMIPYTERHLARMNRLVQESYVVDYILGEMDNGMLMDGEDVVVESTETD